MRTVLAILLLSSVGLAEEHYYAKFDPDTGQKRGMFGPVTNDLTSVRSSCRSVIVEIDAKQYSKETVNDSEARFRDAKTEMESVNAERDYEKLEAYIEAKNAKESDPSKKVTKADFVSAWKMVNSNKVSAIVEPK